MMQSKQIFSITIIYDAIPWQAGAGLVAWAGLGWPGLAWLYSKTIASLFLKTSWNLFKAWCNKTNLFENSTVFSRQHKQNEFKHENALGSFKTSEQIAHSSNFAMDSAIFNYFLSCNSRWKFCQINIRSKSSEQKMPIFDFQRHFFTLICEFYAKKFNNIKT